MVETRPRPIEVPKTGSKLPDSDAYVLEAHRGENGNINVLLFLPGQQFTPFATGVLVTRNMWNWGHYFDVINDAVTDFLERTD